MQTLALAAMLIMVAPTVAAPGDLVRTVRAMAVQVMPGPAPSAEAVQLADAAGMSVAARAIFYAARPVVSTDRAVIAAHCQTPGNMQMIALGCYAPDDRI